MSAVGRNESAVSAGVWLGAHLDVDPAIFVRRQLELLHQIGRLRAQGLRVKGAAGGGRPAGPQRGLLNRRARRHRVEQVLLVGEDQQRDACEKFLVKQKVHGPTNTKKQCIRAFLASEETLKFTRRRRRHRRRCCSTGTTKAMKD